MKILLVAATSAEIAPFLDFLKSRHLFLAANLYRTSHHEIEIIITGVGMVATTFQLTKKLAHHHYDWVIQAGIAGSYDMQLALGTLCWVQSERMGDLGAEDHYRFLDIFDLALQDPNETPYMNGCLWNPLLELPFGFTAIKASALTVNTTSGSETTIATRSNKYHAQLESMEGAAFHWVCLQYGVPFLQLRSISNYVEPRDKDKWEIPKAIEALNHSLAAALG